LVLVLLGPPPAPCPLLDATLLVEAAEPPVPPTAPPLEDVDAHPATAATRTRTTARSWTRNMACISLAKALRAPRLQRRCHLYPPALSPKTRSAGGRPRTRRSP